ncbi:MAG: 1-pyrroline-5-carboxylate dehydrogenase [Candidatus Muiribacterium halophilum]|uniref:L-glutamate gamma-semialdehyde dehydrogenase n=1 Tax=Muiribacterium halophilum TaxID=2053465 RepID=A0A2N5ZKU7_MUIH1|nr:MAG: 1-pyrroline-5-carboxylate dehydrogenase [Candidatus Muirbacterium halophilum]
MSNAYFKVRRPQTEPIKSYKPGSQEKKELKAKINELKSKKIEIPLIIGGKEVKTGNLAKCIIPHDKEHVLAEYHQAGEKEIEMAVEAARKAWKEWSEMPWQHRAAIFLKAAELLAGPWRSTLNAATMLGQSKSAFQAEIDSACELIDFFRFNAYYMTEIFGDQPDSTVDSWNRLEYRPMEGFIFAVTPFNFTSIAGNLPTAPAMVGNVSLWKPASSSVYSGYFIMRLLEEAGLPAGVINFVPGRGSKVGNPVMNNEHLAGVHFTGSTGVFQGMWQQIANNLPKYHCYPRIVGETGGKDFIFAHETADVVALKTALIRGSFEYQGQKCSAASRAFIPENVWKELKDPFIAEVKAIKMGVAEDFTNFFNAVIDKAAFDSIKEYIDYAKSSDDAQIIAGGNCDDSKGFLIEPTVILTTDPYFKTMKEEIFGPVLTIYVYKETELDKALEYCDKGSPYALTGAIFAKDRSALVYMEKALTHAAGNFYINDKPTGAVVSQQPFGGGRASGTNDKAGSKLNLLRWMNPRTIKENLNPPTDYRYPFMDEE